MKKWIVAIISVFLILIPFQAANAKFQAKVTFRKKNFFVSENTISRFGLFVKEQFSKSINSDNETYIGLVNDLQEVLHDLLKDELYPWLLDAVDEDGDGLLVSELMQLLVDFLNEEDQVAEIISEVLNALMDSTLTYANVGPDIRGVLSNYVPSSQIENAYNDIKTAFTSFVGADIAAVLEVLLNDDLGNLLNEYIHGENGEWEGSELYMVLSDLIDNEIPSLLNDFIDNDAPGLLEDAINEFIPEFDFDTYIASLNVKVDIIDGVWLSGTVSAIGIDTLFIPELSLFAGFSIVKNPKFELDFNLGYDRMLVPFVDDLSAFLIGFNFAYRIVPELEITGEIVGGALIGGLLDSFRDTPFPFGGYSLGLNYYVTDNFFLRASYSLRNMTDFVISAFSYLIEDRVVPGYFEFYAGCKF